MSNTPETDAMLHDCGDEYNPSMQPHSEGDWVQACFARKLERERDEAIQKRHQWRECSARLLVYAESLLAHIPDTSEINWTVLEQARAMFKEGEVK